jgi:hypothetical protein
MKKHMKTYLVILIGLLTVCTSRATVIMERFTNDPAMDGWQVYGDTNLFQWDSTNLNLDVTWDSTQTNSYFFHYLDKAYSKTNDFVLTFDINMSDMTVGVTANEPYSFEIALGLINTSIATNSAYFRGYGYFPDIVEFDYFPDDGQGDGPSVDPLIISSQTNYSGGGFTYPLQMQTGTLYHVYMYYTATNQTLSTTMAADGQPFGPVENAYLGGGFDDFQEDAISINSYSDGGQDPDFSGSILAHGIVSRLAFVSPVPVASVAFPALGTVQFSSDTNWVYTLEQAGDFQTWTAATPTVRGNGTNLTLQATSLPSDKAFYRVRADLP